MAVGITSHSSYDMYMSGGRGKCVEILHALGDTLCQLGKPPARPNLGSPFLKGGEDHEDHSLSEELKELDVQEDVDAETTDERLTASMKKMIH